MPGGLFGLGITTRHHAPLEGAVALLNQAVLYLDARDPSAATQTWRNLGTGGSALNAVMGSGTGTDSNDPKHLPWDGSNYAYLPGLNGNNLNCTDTAGFNITGDIELVTRVRADSYSTGAVQHIATRDQEGTTRSWRWSLTADNRLEFTFFPDGTYANRRAFKSTTDNPFSANTWYWIKISAKMNNGSSGVDVRFEYAPDRPTEPETWSQIGSTVTAAGVGSIYAGTDYLLLGSRNFGQSELLSASYSRFIIRDGIGGRTALDINTAQIATGSAASFKCATGQTISVSRASTGRKTAIVTRSLLLFGTDDYAQIADSPLTNFNATDSFTVIWAGRQWATPSASYGRFLQKGAAAHWEITSYGSNNATATFLTDGTNSANYTIAPAFTFGKTLVFGAVVDRTTQKLTGYTNGVPGGSGSIAAVGSLANAEPLRIGSSAILNNFGDFEQYAVLIFRRVLSPSEFALVNNYLQSVWS